MNFNTAIKCLSAATLLAFAGCTQQEAPTEVAAQPLKKSAASEINACPKYNKFIQSFAVDFQSCAMQGGGDCVGQVLGALEPIFTCLEIEVPANATLQDFADMSLELNDKVTEFDQDQSKAMSFVSCLCGDGFEEAVNTVFSGANSTSASAYVSGNSTAATGYSSGNSSSATGFTSGGSTSATAYGAR